MVNLVFSRGGFTAVSLENKKIESWIGGSTREKADSLASFQFNRGVSLQMIAEGNAISLTYTL